jgi:hypothetical protein
MQGAGSRQRQIAFPTVALVSAPMSGNPAGTKPNAERGVIHEDGR